MQVSFHIKRTDSRWYFDSLFSCGLTRGPRVCTTAPRTPPSHSLALILHPPLSSPLSTEGTPLNDRMWEVHPNYVVEWNNGALLQ